MTLYEAIDKFLSDLELTDKQADNVKNRQAAVRVRAESSRNIEIEDSYLIGSYKRDTQIRPISTGLESLFGIKPTEVVDVDCLLVLKNSPLNNSRYWEVEDGGAAILSALYTYLKGHQGREVEVDAPSVTIKWDGMKMEVTPCFHRKGGGFLVPAPSFLNPTWKATNPIEDARLFTEGNKACNEELKPMVKMLKCWKRTHELPLTSFALECVAYHSAKNSYKGFEFELLWFFRSLLDAAGKTVSAPAGIGAEIPVNIGFLNEDTVNNSKTSIETAFGLSKVGKDAQAIKLFGEVFGKPFPGVS